MIFIGAGGHAKVVLDAWLCSKGKVTGIYDDDPAVQSLLNYPVAGSIDSIQDRESHLFLSIGNNRTRFDLKGRFSDRQFGKVVHPAAIVASDCVIGEGTVAMAGVVINRGTTIGCHCIVNTGATVDHDSRIDNFVHIAPGATLCGGIKVGEGTLVGAGSVVLPNVVIGRWCVIGAGAVVRDAVPDGAVVAGNPARRID